ncbi:MAG: hypothetical protein J6Q15_01190, partial [Clostridia bacterium]|nr:hypothetical protein [Clostridia bacterium]
MSNILNTKVKFYRNLKDMAFSTTINSNSQQDLLKLGLDACTSCGLKAEQLETLSDNVINSLVASNQLEQEFVINTKYKGYASNNNASVQINGNSHIEIMANELSMQNAYANAKQVDKLLCNKLHFAYNDKYGFLNADIRRLGSGMTISTLVALPALTKLNAIKNLPKSNDKLIFNIEPINAYGGIYLITNGPSLGYSEKQICELTSSYIDKVVKCEIEMSKTLAKDKIEVTDKASRAKAIINSCIKISPDELYGLIGDVLIAINSGLQK